MASSVGRSSAAIRQEFIDFFVAKAAHTKWPSSSVVPYNDPSLLFINAGMNQFKAKFLGDIDATSPLAPLKRVVNSQKCIRAGGKHNDLDDVGKDVYHHTFFEMLGNWSFGDFFKTEAIAWAWQLITEEWKIPADRLYATYFGGDPKLPDCPPDEQARLEWEKYLPACRVMPFGMTDNFWEMADTGPCGPCSELHYDRIGGRDASQFVNMDDPSCLELWNLVFMQYNRETDGSLTLLPSPCVDTGMGLERVASVIQGVDSNYDTDLFVPIFEAVQQLIPSLRPYTRKVGVEDTERIDMAYRVIADHIRTLVISVADGALPSNEGRGYVLRRILRRAVRYGRQFLGAPRDKVWFCHLVDTVVTILGDAFPELCKDPEYVKKILREEEVQFGKTLDKGVSLFERAVNNLPTGVSVLAGKTAFDLYATYGFPLDLTVLMAGERGFEVDVPAFHQAFDAHQRASDKHQGDRHELALLRALKADQIHELETVINAPPTIDTEKYKWTPSEETGHVATGVVVAIWNGNTFVDVAAANSTVTFILDRTNFYAESGGQVGDVGMMTSQAGAEAAVLDTQKYSKFILHVVKISNADVNVKDAMELHVDYRKRAHSAKNHTATHVLNFALRQVLCCDCDQKGSLVEPSRLRFDFSFGQPLTDHEVDAVEVLVRSVIQQDLPIYADSVPFAQAKAIEGLRAVFGEVYPDPVRVVSVGHPIPALLNDSQGGGLSTSVEFCGGTHLHHTGTIEDFVIISEESIARNIRRIVAVTGDYAKDAVKFGAELRSKCTGASSLAGRDLDRALAVLTQEVNNAKDLIPHLCRKACKSLLAAMQRKQVEEGKLKLKFLLKEAETLGQHFAEQHATGTTSYALLSLDELAGEFKAMESFVQAFHKKAPTRPVCVLSRGTDSFAVLSVVPTPADDLNAREWVAACMEKCGGKCGGKATTSRGSAKLPLTAQQMEEGFAAAKQYIQRCYR